MFSLAWLAWGQGQPEFLGGVPRAGMASAGLIGGLSELSKCIGRHYDNIRTAAFTECFLCAGVIPFHPTPTL